MPDREKVINKVTAIVADMQEEVDEWKDYSDSELRGGLTCDCDWWYKTLQTLKDALALLKAQEPREMSDAELMDAIRKAPIIVKPTVDAAPVKCGQWTERHVDYASDCAIDEVQTAKCSVCGLYHTTPYLYSFTDFKFCPNCGATMKGVRTWEP